MIDKAVFVRAIRGQLIDGVRVAATERYETLTSEYKTVKGYLGTRAMLNIETGQFITTTYWKTQEDMLAFEDGGWFLSVMTELDQFVEGEMRVEYYQQVVDDMSDFG